MSKREYLCEREPRDPARERVFELLAWCEVAEEDFDRSVCGYVAANGIAIPTTTTERIACNMNAKHLTDLVRRAMRDEGLAPELFRKVDQYEISPYLQRGARGIEDLRKLGKGPKPMPVVAYITPERARIMIRR